MKRLTAISLFCGAGGLDIGFQNSGFNIIWANDIDKDACETHRMYFSTPTICSNISKITSDEIPDSDIILGGFPCQGFSLSGPRKIDDSRNKLYKEYVRIVKEKRPKAFIGENVKGLLSMSDGQIIEAIIEDFSKCGYNVFYKLVNAKNYNVPQDRERVLIVGFRKDLNINDFAFPEPNDDLITLKQALNGLEKPKNDEICMQPYSSRYMSRNRKRNWDEVSFTIPAMAKQVPLHPSSPDMIKLDKDLWKFGEGVTRRFSTKECAIIQTFPKDFKFYGNQTSIYKQIGNAVPIKLAENIATKVYNELTKNNSQK